MCASGNRSRAASTTSATREVLAQLEYQAGQAEVWRDAVANWFLRESGIPDAKGRVGHYPGRFEAESMQLAGLRSQGRYAVGGRVAAERRSSAPRADCAATLHYNGRARMVYDSRRVLRPGRWRLALSAQRRKPDVDEWAAPIALPTRKVDGSSSTRRTIPGVALRTGDEIRIEGIPDGGEKAALDYIELLPD